MTSEFSLIGQVGQTFL